MSESSLLNRREAAARCGVSLSAFLRHVAPHLTPKRIGRRVFFREADVEALSVTETERRQLALRRKRAPEPEDIIARAAQLAETDPVFRASGPGVYVIRAGARMKIGKAARSIQQRLNNMQVANADKLELLAVLSTDPADERLAHAALARFRIRGEWFRANGESLAVVRTLIERGLRGEREP